MSKVPPSRDSSRPTGAGSGRGGVKSALKGGSVSSAAPAASPGSSAASAALLLPPRTVAGLCLPPVVHLLAAAARECTARLLVHAEAVRAAREAAGACVEAEAVVMEVDAALPMLRAEEAHEARAGEGGREPPSVLSPQPRAPGGGIGPLGSPLPQRPMGPGGAGRTTGRGSRVVGEGEEGQGPAAVALATALTIRTAAAEQREVYLARLHASLPAVRACALALLEAGVAWRLLAHHTLIAAAITRESTLKAMPYALQLALSNALRVQLHATSGARTARSVSPPLGDRIGPSTLAAALSPSLSPSRSISPGGTVRGESSTDRGFVPRARGELRRESSAAAVSAYSGAPTSKRTRFSDGVGPGSPQPGVHASPASKGTFVAGRASPASATLLACTVRAHLLGALRRAGARGGEEGSLSAVRAALSSAARTVPLLCYGSTDVLSALATSLNFLAFVSPFAEAVGYGVAAAEGVEVQDPQEAVARASTVLLENPLMQSTSLATKAASVLEGGGSARAMLEDRGGGRPPRGSLNQARGGRPQFAVQVSDGEGFAGGAEGVEEEEGMRPPTLLPANPRVVNMGSLGATRPGGGGGGGVPPFASVVAEEDMDGEGGEYGDDEFDEGGGEEEYGEDVFEDDGPTEEEEDSDPLCPPEGRLYLHAAVTLMCGSDTPWIAALGPALATAHGMSAPAPLGESTGWGAEQAALASRLAAADAALLFHAAFFRSHAPLQTALGVRPPLARAPEGMPDPGTGFSLLVCNDPVGGPEARMLLLSPSGPARRPDASAVALPPGLVPFPPLPAPAPPHRTVSARRGSAGGKTGGPARGRQPRTPAPAPAPSVDGSEGGTGEAYEYDFQAEASAASAPAGEAAGGASPRTTARSGRLQWADDEASAELAAAAAAAPPAPTPAEAAAAAEYGIEGWEGEEVEDIMSGVDMAAAVAAAEASAKIAWASGQSQLPQQRPTASPPGHASGAHPGSTGRPAGSGLSALRAARGTSAGSRGVAPSPYELEGPERAVLVGGGKGVMHARPGSGVASKGPTSRPASSASSRAANSVYSTSSSRGKGKGGRSGSGSEGKAGFVDLEALLAVPAVPFELNGLTRGRGFSGRPAASPVRGTVKATLAASKRMMTAAYSGDVRLLKPRPDPPGARRSPPRRRSSAVSAGGRSAERARSRASSPAPPSTPPIWRFAGIHPVNQGEPSSRPRTPSKEETAKAVAPPPTPRSASAATGQRPMTGRRTPAPAPTPSLVRSSPVRSVASAAASPAPALVGATPTLGTLSPRGGAARGAASPSVARMPSDPRTLPSPARVPAVLSAAASPVVARPSPLASAALEDEEYGYGAADGFDESKEGKEEEAYADEGFEGASEGGLAPEASVFMSSPRAGDGSLTAQRGLTLYPSEGAGADGEGSLGDGMPGSGLLLPRAPQTAGSRNDAPLSEGARSYGTESFAALEKGTSLGPDGEECGAPSPLSSPVVDGAAAEAGGTGGFDAFALDPASPEGLRLPPEVRPQSDREGE